jgi:hypothetical protein
MDPDAVKSTLSNLAYGNVIAAAARDYQKVAHPSPSPQRSSAALRGRPGLRCNPFVCTRAELGLGGV